MGGGERETTRPFERAESAASKNVREKLIPYACTFNSCKIGHLRNGCVREESNKSHARDQGAEAGA